MRTRNYRCELFEVAALQHSLPQLLQHIPRVEWLGVDFWRGDVFVGGGVEGMIVQSDLPEAFGAVGGGGVVLVVEDEFLDGWVSLDFVVDGVEFVGRECLD